MAPIRSIQALRAMAAISVVFGHTLSEATKMPMPPSFSGTPILLDIAGAGSISIFFAQGGDILIEGAAESAKRFLWL